MRIRFRKIVTSAQKPAGSARMGADAATGADLTGGDETASAQNRLFSAHAHHIGTGRSIASAQARCKSGRGTAQASAARVRRFTTNSGHRE
jgi:hypothetical protein